MCVCMHASMYACMCIYMYVCVFIYICVCVEPSALPQNILASKF